MCGADLSGIGVIRRFTAALMLGNKSRDPHVGPYCKDCGPPAMRETKKIEYVKDCPVTGEEWTPVDGHCMTFSKRPRRASVPRETNKCEYCLRRSPFTPSSISCIHPARLKKKREEKQKKSTGGKVNCLC